MQYKFTFGNKSFNPEATIIKQMLKQDKRTVEKPPTL